MNFLRTLLYIPIFRRQMTLPDGTNIHHDLYALPVLWAVAMIVKVLK